MPTTAQRAVPKSPASGLAAHYVDASAQQGPNLPREPCNCRLCGVSCVGSKSTSGFLPRGGAPYMHELPGTRPAPRSSLKIVIRK